MLYNIRFILCLTLFLFFIVIIYNSQNNNSNYFSTELLSNNSIISGNAKIIDGDSIIITNNEIRLQDIDAPEYDQKCYDLMNLEYNCGLDAKNYLKNLTYAKEVICKISGRDFYERFLATCYLSENDININREIVKSGHAVKYGSLSKYYQEELYAKTKKLGIWQGSFITPRQHRKNR